MTIGNNEFFGIKGHEKESEIRAVLFNAKTYKIITKSVANFPFQNNGSCTFGGVLLNSKIFIGFGRGVYEYLASENKWRFAQIPEHIEHSRSRAQGCCITEDTYLLCGGDLRTKVELLKYNEAYFDNVDQTEDVKSGHVKASHVFHLPNRIEEDDELYISSQISNTSRHDRNFFFHSILQCMGLGISEMERDAAFQQNQIKDAVKHKKESEMVSSGTNTFQYIEHQCDQCSLFHDFCSSPLPLTLTGGHTVTSLEPGKVMLVGGYCGGSASEKVFIGRISEDKKDVTWTETDSLRNAREYHITFKMKGNVFVAGGVDTEYEALSICEQFSSKSNKWVISKHQLPYPLVNATVIVSKDETFSLIVGGWKKVENDNKRILSGEALVFTLEHGFKRLSSGLNFRSIRGRDVIFKLY